MHTSPRRPTQRAFRALAAILAIEVVAAMAVPVASAAVSAGRPAAGAARAVEPVVPAVAATPGSLAPWIATRPPLTTAPALRTERTDSLTGWATNAARSTATRQPAKAKASVRRERTPQRVAVTRPRALHGRNHVWSSALGLDRTVAWFPCSRKRAPDAAVYRWGCAGANNVYLLAHAGGPFGRLHDLYVRGALRRGMTVTYADGSGRIHRYAVAWWRAVLPTQGDFAFAALSRSSMTLQTCVGSGDRYRLVVRLYETR